MTAPAPSVAQQRRLADAIASGRFSVDALHSTYAAAAAAGEPFEAVLDRALDHADQGGAMLAWQTHRAWQPPPVEAQSPAWHRASATATDDASDVAIIRGVAAMTSDGRARFLSQGLSEAEIDALAEAIIATPEGRRQADAVGYVPRAARASTAPAATSLTTTAPTSAPTGDHMTDADRCAAIDALILPGHEALIAACKADPACTPSQAALRIMAAERARRGPASANAAATGGTPEAWRAEFAASAELQREFGTVERYANYQTGVAAGRVRRFTASDRPTSAPIRFFGFGEKR